jgi:hypothetical protein
VIVVDPLFSTAPFTTAKTPRCFRNTRSCHMMSTLEGEEGTAELVAFAKRIGLKPEWIQKPGTTHEHFDLTERRRAAALKAGAHEVWRGWKRGEAVQAERPLRFDQDEDLRALRDAMERKRREMLSLGARNLQPEKGRR